MNTQLLIIDPQNDFCDLPGAALPVAGADADLRRLAALIAMQGAQFDAIHITLDSHHAYDIAHPSWWRDANGKLPAPFTVISQQALREGQWQSADPAQQTASLAYVAALEQAGRYQLMIWPEHCLVGSWGHGIHRGLQEALQHWSHSQRKPLHYHHKGLNPASEHYSAIRAEVPLADDLATQGNPALIKALAQADRIVIAGEALSHCVASTVRDLAEAVGAEKLVLLRDCMSSVAGFEAAGEAFLAEIKAMGAQVTHA